MIDKKPYIFYLLLIAGFIFSTVLLSPAEDRPQWGEKHTRNMVSDEKNLVDNFDPVAGTNVKWTSPMGNQTWGSPIIAEGKVFIGTNNNPPHDPRHKGDRGILLCLNEKDGSLLWQLVVPKLGPDMYLDWPQAGLSSPVAVEGNFVYAVTNRNEVVCLDINGLQNGNDGPYKDEALHMRVEDDQAAEAFPEKDADIIWLYDVPKQAGTYPHDAAHASILIDGDFLYLNTSNGVDNTHRKIRKPDGPSIIVLDKKTGRLVARDQEGIGPRIFHSTWSSPAMGTVNGQKQIYFGGGDGVVYAFEALQTMPKEGEVAALKRVWRFDCDPTAPKENVSEYSGNRDISPSNIKGMPVFYKNRIYVAAGGDIWWGKSKAWLTCIDAAKTGDITSSGSVWQYEMNQHCCTTPAICNGLAYINDCGGMVHCLDAETGKPLWTHKAGGEVWASPFVADGKVYIANKFGTLWILSAGKEKKILREIKLDSPIAGTPTAANGVLYVATMKKLYALQNTNP